MYCHRAIREVESPSPRGSRSRSPGVSLSTRNSLEAMSCRYPYTADVHSVSHPYRGGGRGEGGGV